MRGYFLEQLAVDVDGEIEARDWLTFPEHGLRMFTAGAVYHDEVGLQAVRDRLAYYPRDVWLYLLVAGWWRVHPEVNLVGRAGSVGDELGSALIGSRLVSDLMRLCFLMERQYAPYSKWFGTAFSRLACGPELSPTLWRVVAGRDLAGARGGAAGGVREAGGDAQRAAAHRAGLHGGRADVEPAVQGRLGRLPGPAAAPRSRIRRCSSIAERWPIGPVDQFRDLLWPARNRRLLLRLFDQEDDNEQVTL